MVIAVIPPLHLIHAGIETLLVTAIASLLPSIGPISLTAGAGFGIATGTFAIAEGLAGLATVGALLGLQYALTPRPGDPAQIDPGKLKETFTASDSPETRLVGRGRVSGLQAFGDTNGLNRFRLILHCKGTVDAVETYYVGNREVTVETDGTVSSPPWPHDGGSYLSLFTDLGDPNKTAWSLLLANFSGLWTSDHRARGIAQTLAFYLSPGRTTTDAADKFMQLYQGGLPQIDVLLRGENSVYDTRTSASGWSENGILNALHILLSYPEFSLSNFDTAFISSEADRADVLTSRYGAVTTKRARCWGFWTSELKRGDVMQQVLDSIGAWIVPRTNGSQLGIQLIDDDPAAETTVALDNILDYTWRSGPEAVERPNVCNVYYYSPERNYELTQIDLTGIAWARIDDEIAANGEKPYDVKLPFCPDSGQAQQIARRLFALARADTGVIHTNFAGMAVLGCRVINVEFPDGLGTLKCKVEVPRILDDKGQIEIPFTVWPTLTAWDTATDEAAPPAAIPDLSYAGLTQPNVPAASTIITYPDASIVTRVGYSVPGDGTTVEAVYRTYTAGLPNAWQGMTEYVGNDGTAHAYVGVNLSGSECDFRFRTFNGTNNSAWSPILNAVVPATNTAPSVPTLAFSGSAPTLDMTATAPDNLDVGYLQFTGVGAPAGSIPTKPGEAHGWSADVSTLLSGSTSTWTAQAFSSNGTAGPTATVTYTAP